MCTQKQGLPMCTYLRKTQKCILCTHLRSAICAHKTKAICVHIWACAICVHIGRLPAAFCVHEAAFVYTTEAVSSCRACRAVELPFSFTLPTADRKPQPIGCVAGMQVSADTDSVTLLKAQARETPKAATRTRFGGAMLRAAAPVAHDELTLAAARDACAARRGTGRDQ